MRTLITTTALFLALLSPLRTAAQIRPQDATGPAPIPQADSLRTPIIPIPLVGSIDRTLDSNYVITSADLPFLEYRSVIDILARLPGSFVRGLASPGLATGLTLRGAGAQSIAVLSDGVALNEPLTGAYNFAFYPTEQIERIELVPATRAFLYAMNGSGGLLNIVSKSKKALVAQSRIRYSESAHGYGFVDGSVSQDIIRGLNVSAGLQHVTFDRRFLNSAYDAWTTHAKIRYNVTNSVNVFASLIANSTELGLNGGVDRATPDTLQYEELRASVVNTDAYEKITRYDTQAGVAVRPSFDSTGVSTLTVYLSTQLREYRDEENRLLPNGIMASEDHRSQWFGVRLLHQQSIGEHSLDLGAEIGSRAVIASPSAQQHRETDKSVFGLLTLRPAGELSASGYARLDEYQARTRLSYGGDITLHPHMALSLFGGYSRSFRFPSFQESFWNDSALTSTGLTTPERHDVFEGGVRYEPGAGLRVAVTLFRRVVHDAILLIDDSSASAQARFIGEGREAINGASLEARTRLSWFLAEAIIDLFDGGRTLGAGIPGWQVQCGAYFFDTVLNGHLELKSGLKGNVTDAFRRNSFDERRQTFVGLTHTIASAGTLDFVLIGHLGDAYVHFLWENLLGREYLTTYLYPMEGRAIRFGISWDFLN